MSGKNQLSFGQNVNFKFQNTPFIGSEIKMDDSILLPMKICFTFFDKEHAKWSSISGVMIKRSWKIKFGKLKIDALAS